MYQTVNGWTKSKMVEHIKANFRGKSMEVITRSDGSKSEGIGCSYRGLDGKKCAVGLFIPDEAYNPDFEKRSITNEALSLVQKFMPLPPYGMLEMQAVHDGSGSAETLGKILRWIHRRVEDKV